MKLLSFSLLANTRNLWLLMFALIAFTACTPDEELITLGEDETNLIITEEAAEAEFEEVESLGVDALEMTDLSSYSRMGGGWIGPDLLTGNCPTLNNDSLNKILTIDFGTSCTGADGKVRSGEIIVSYTQRLYRPGASLQISPNNYFVDGKQIEGTKTLTNTMVNFRDTISFQTTLVGGKVTWPDGSFAEREFTSEGKWLRGANPLQDEYQREGSIEGVRRNGNTYEGEITSPLIYKRRCKAQGIHIAVEGTRLIKRSGKPDLEIDYGNGLCDHLISLTQNGQSRTIDVRNL
ncbi:MAG: hypothetical protein AAF696_00805 [Bacteroidota bacterium]